MLERILSFLALLTLCGFLGILFWKVPRLDLGVVIAITLVLAAIDLLFRRGSKSGS
jgi:uncharacterized membrane protein YqjE